MKNTDTYWDIWIDTGGTFTDCLATDPDGRWHRTKVLSNSSLRGKITATLQHNQYKIEQDWNTVDHFIRDFTFRLLNIDHAPVSVEAFDAARSIVTLDSGLGDIDPEGESFEVVSREEPPLLAARLITDTRPEEELPPLNLRLATTRGTNALLELKGAPTALFITSGFGDLMHIGTQQRPELFALDIQKPPVLFDEVIEVEERLDADGNVLTPICLSSIENKVDDLLRRGIRSAAVALMHSYNNPIHERHLGQWLKDRGFDYVSTSSELSQFIKLLPRTETTLVNAYLIPIIQEYLYAVRSEIKRGKLYIMTSAGGLVHASKFTPKDSLLSGPAGGVVGASTAGKKAGFQKIISFDMGGTSTDVARYDGDYEYVFEHQVGNAHLVSPALSIETVAAGGGSICSFDGHKLNVGPESAGAFPGPACYGAGGPLTITDVNLLLGRLDQRNFNIPVSMASARDRLDEIVDKVSKAEGREIQPETVLEGFLNIANERMSDAIRKISLRKGYDPTEYGLVSFGGAGSQHCCAIADRLGIRNVIIPTDAGLLSAYGLGNAVLEQFAERQMLKPVEEVRPELPDTLNSLAEEALDQLAREGVPKEHLEVRRKLVFMRLKGQESTLEIEYEQDADLAQKFESIYKRRYGHWVSNPVIEIESLRVVASTRSELSRTTGGENADLSPEAIDHKAIWFNQQQKDTPVYDRQTLHAGAKFTGPAFILDPHSTIVVEPGWEVKVQPNGTLTLLHNEEQQPMYKNGQPEAVNLELFTNRFSSIAEEMGEMLQRTSLSVNVKERLDFSCALLNPSGELVVNAPHIPVHLGALGMCVRSLIEHIEMKPGDVVITNHPAYGGAHLPDVTVVTPIYTPDEELIGYAASRAHHAEIGGSRPGSMPPNATRLSEEGVVIPPMHLIRRGEEQWEKVQDHLLHAEWPTRSIDENIADLRAAVAANHRGAESLRNLVKKYGSTEVLHYMNELKHYAGRKMRETITRIADGEYLSREMLDDQTPINAAIAVKGDHITIDFKGTGPVHPNNLNATPAIVNSVVMYVLRLLIDEPLPLNEGLLDPVELKMPTCLLNPAFDTDPGKCPAVVGGNVEVSQRLVDTLLKPFNRAACSQGTMNNVLFGNDRFGYYETVGGGSGAGPDFDGADAVHQHMTNTRGTDPEIFEHRYPVRLDLYGIRRGSGGKGRFTGGNGIVREMTFLEPVSLSVLTQHRLQRPYGLEGGEEAAPGEQWVIRKDGRRERLDPVDGRDLEPGDRFILHTPGGGGFGKS